MNALINIQDHDGQQCVNARELHGFLESKQEFSNWVKSRITKYGFTEGVDFTIDKFINGKATQKDYLISIDMAKELSMVEQNEKGKQARQYFIECEKQLRVVKPTLSFEEQVKLTLGMAQEKIEALECKVMEDAPKVALHDLKHDCGTAISGKDFSDRLPIGVVKLYDLLRDWNWMCKKASHCPTSPTRYAIERGYLVAKTFSGHHADGKPFEKISSRITEKGQQRIIKKLAAAGIMAEEAAA